MIRNILVTGASGFIGKNLCRILTEEGFNVSGMDSSDGDIANQSTLSSIPGIDFVFHLAGKTYVPDSWNNPTEFHRVNVLGTSNVLEFCRLTKVPLTFISAYIYGIPDTLPVSEDFPVRPNNPYAFSKRFAEQLCEFYSENFDVDITIVRPFNIFGPGQRNEFFIPTVLHQAIKGKLINIEDLSPKRDYLYVDDLVSALIKTIECTDGLNIYNLGSGYSLSVREIISIVEQVLGKELEVKSNNRTRENEIMNVFADIRKATLELDWRPNHSFEEGIKSMISRATI